MGSAPPPRPRPAGGAGYHDSSDAWLIDAARRAGHPVALNARPAGTSAWRMLLGAGLSDDQILKLAVLASGADPADLSRVSPAIAQLLPHEAALRHRVAPVGLLRGAVAVATVNPQNPAVERELAFACKQRVVLQAASPSDILRAQGIIYGAANYGRTLNLDAPPPPSMQPRPAPVGRLSGAVQAPIDVHTTGEHALPKSDGKNSPAALVERLLTTAAGERGSEAHVEPLKEGGCLVRLRVDGKLNDRFRVADVHTRGLFEQLKSMAGLDSSLVTAARAGVTTFSSAHGVLQLRVQVEPAGAVERVVIRLHAPQSSLSLNALGLSSTELRSVEVLLGEPEGVVVVAGPGGAGRTTTLYAALAELRLRGRAGVTLEESVAWRIDAARQTALSDSPYPTTASAVRAALGQGADVVLIELPADTSTVEAIVGDARRHLVLMSLDVPETSSVMKRLRDLEIDPAALAAPLRGVISQRLVRRLCNCAVPQPLADLPDSQQSLLIGMPTTKLRRAVGCQTCRGTGFAGRAAIAEVVPFTAALRAALAHGAEPRELERLARETGASTLWDSGLQRVLDGTTTIGELLDCVPAPANAVDAAGHQQDIDALLSQLLGSSVIQPTPVATPKVTPIGLAAVAAANATASPAAPLRILVVEDDVHSRRTLAEDLKKAGFTVIEAADGEAGLSYARRLKPDAIVAEVALPKLDAIGLLQALAGELPRPSLVVYTSQDDAALRDWLRESGAVDVLRKASGPSALAERLRSVVRARSAA